jgi:predicted RNase H-like HicB family nuclease
MKIKVIAHEKDDGYWVEVPLLPGCFTQAYTWPELLQNLY